MLVHGTVPETTALSRRSLLSLDIAQLWSEGFLSIGGPVEWQTSPKSLQELGKSLTKDEDL